MRPLLSLFVLFVCLLQHTIHGRPLQIPVLLDGVLTMFSINVLPCRDPRFGNVLRQSVREFCFAKNIKYNDCKTMISEVELHAQSLPCEEVHNTSHESPTTRVKKLQWGSNHHKTHDQFYIQLVSQSVLLQLNPLTQHVLAMTFDDQHVLRNQFGRKSATWHFLSSYQSESLHCRSFLFDDVLNYEKTDLTIVVPNAPYELPWSPHPPGEETQSSTLILLFDGNDSQESVQQYLRRCQNLVLLLQYHRRRGQHEIGLIVMGDQRGLFPSSIYAEANFSMREYYYPDHVVGLSRPPRWLPLSPMFFQNSVVDIESNEKSGGRDNGNSNSRDVLLLAIIEDKNNQTDTKNLLCGRGTAESTHSNSGGSGSSGSSGSGGGNLQRRCYKSWAQQDITEVMNMSSYFVTKNSNDPDLLMWIRRSTFVIAPPEHVSIGSESKILWTALENGAVPIIAGPAYQLGLEEFGRKHPIPEVKKTHWKAELLLFVKPFLEQHEELQGDQGVQQEDEQGKEKEVDQEFTTVSVEVVRRQLLRLQQRVASWYQQFRRSMSCKHIFDEEDDGKESDIVLQHPFEFLLSSYIHWNQAVNSQAKKVNQNQVNHLDLSYRAALFAVEMNISPSVLRIFALENVAAAEQYKGLKIREEGQAHWQENNRRSLGKKSLLYLVSSKLDFFGSY